MNVNDVFRRDADLALWAIDEKVHIIASVRDSRREHRNVLAAVAEACWWIASLDEQLEKLRASSYKTARDRDPRGFPILGLRWARHRHSHDLINTSDGSVQPFISDKPGVMLFISDPYTWRTVDSMNLTGDSAKRNPDQRARYVAALEGKEVHKSLLAAHGWLSAAAKGGDFTG